MLTRATSWETEGGQTGVRRGKGTFGHHVKVNTVSGVGCVIRDSEKRRRAKIRITEGGR